MSTAPFIQSKLDPHKESAWLSAAIGRADNTSRATGIENTVILKSIDADVTTVLAGLVCGWAPLSAEDSKVAAARYGEQVIEVASRAHQIGQLAFWLGEHNSRSVDRAANEENFRKLLIAMVDDVRIVLVCLANHQTRLKFAKTGEKDLQRNLAAVTLDVFAPLANRLGIWQLKWELEDYALRYSNPGTYKALAHALEEKRIVRESYIESLVSLISRELAEAGIAAEVTGRPKHIYSIWKKMRSKGLEFGELWDIRAVRILTGDVSDCYAALGVVHANWNHFPSEFADYIATPKSNGYRSIHTVVRGPEDKSVEIQVRTHEMHEESELGVAAHWRYKEGVGQDSSIEARVVWLRQLLAWKSEVLGSVPDEIDQGRVYVFTPLGTIIDLPQGSTPIDFAYAVHTEVGHRTRGATVNGKMVPLERNLITGDLVAIQTVKTGGPSRDWLRQDQGYIRTSRARNRIQHWFKQSDQAQNLTTGRSLIDREIKRLGLEDLSYEKINHHTHFSNVDDMLAAIGAGDFKASRALSPFRKDSGEVDQIRVRKARRNTPGRNGEFVVHGMGNLVTSLAKCCNPLPGDAIIGYITQSRGVTIHTIACENITRLEPGNADRLIEVDWGHQDGTPYVLGVRLQAFKRSGLLHDITELLNSENVDVLKVDMQTDDEQITRLNLELEISSNRRPETIISRLHGIQNVLEVKRVV